LLGQFQHPRHRRALPCRGQIGAVVPRDLDPYFATYLENRPTIRVGGVRYATVFVPGGIR
jgi:hypothetical protein